MVENKLNLTTFVHWRPNWRVKFDREWYLARYPDIAPALASGELGDPLYHYIHYGYLEGRFPCAAAEEWENREPRSGEPYGSPQIEIGGSRFPLDWPVRGEPSKSYALRLMNGFFEKYMSGAVILDIGYKGGFRDAVPIVPHALGIDIDFPGYHGVQLPFADESVDTVFASHVLEHVDDYRSIIREWHRVVKVGGTIICIVPHQFLYERKTAPPSLWNEDHKRFYTPAALLREFEESLYPNSYRVLHLADNDWDYAYHLAAGSDPTGCYEIDLVIGKISPPAWTLTS